MTLHHILDPRVALPAGYGQCRRCRRQFTTAQWAADSVCRPTICAYCGAVRGPVHVCWWGNRPRREFEDGSGYEIL